MCESRYRHLQVIKNISKMRLGSTVKGQSLNFLFQKKEVAAM